MALEQIGAQAVLQGLDGYVTGVRQMGSETAKAGGQIEHAAQQASASGGHFAGLSKGIALAGGAIAGALAGFVSVTAMKSAIGAVQELSAGVYRLSTVTGMSAEESSRLLHVFEHFGIETNTAVRALTVFQNKLKGIEDQEESNAATTGASTAATVKAEESVSVATETAALAQRKYNDAVKAHGSASIQAEQARLSLTKATNGLSTAQAVLDATNAKLADPKASKVAQQMKDLGINIEGADGKIKPTNETLGDLAEAIKNLPPGMERVAAVSNIFGTRIGAQLLPALELGRDGFMEVAREADKLGLTLTGKNVEDIRNYGFAQKGLSETLGGLKVQLGLSILPLFTAFTKGLTEIIPHVRRLEQSILDFIRPALTVGLNAIVKAFELISGAADKLLTWIQKLVDKGFSALGRVLGGGFKVNFFGELRAELQGLFALLTGGDVAPEFLETKLGKIALAVKDFVTKAISAFKTIPDGLIAIGASIEKHFAGTFGKVLQTVKTFISALLLGLRGGIIPPGSLFSSLIQQAAATGKAIHDHIIEPIRSFLSGGTLKDLIGVFEAALGGNIGSELTPIEKFAASVGTAFRELGPVIEKAVLLILDVAGKLFEDFLKLVQFIVSDVIPTVTALVGWFLKLAEKLGLIRDPLKDLGGKGGILDILAANADLVAKAIEGWLAVMVVKKVLDFAEAVGKVYQNFLNVLGIPYRVFDAIRSTVEKLRYQMELLKDAVGNVVDNLRNLVSKTVTITQNVIRAGAQFLDKLVDLFHTVTQFVVRTGDQFIENIGDLFQTVHQKVVVDQPSGPSVTAPSVQAPDASGIGGIISNILGNVFGGGLTIALEKIVEKGVFGRIFSKIGIAVGFIFGGAIIEGLVTALAAAATTVVAVVGLPVWVIIGIAIAAAIALAFVIHFRKKILEGLRALGANLPEVIGTAFGAAAFALITVLLSPFILAVGLFKKVLKPVGGAVIEGISDGIDEGLGFLSRTLSKIASFILDQLSSLPGEIAGVLSTLPGLITSIVSSAADAIVDILRPIPGKVLEFLEPLPGNIANIFASIPGMILDAILDMPALIGSFFEAEARGWTEIFSGEFLSGINDVFLGLPIIVATAVVGVATEIAKLPGAFLSVVGAVEAAITGTLSTALGLVGGLFSSTFGAVPGIVGGALDDALRAVKGWSIVESITSTVSRFTDAVESAFVGLNTRLKKLTDVDIMGIIGDLIALIAGIPGKMLGLLGDFSHAGKSLADAIYDGMKSGISMFADLGRQIAEAVFKGIVDAPADKVKGFFSGLVKVGKDTLGIKSPSTEGIYIGNMLATGVDVGLTTGLKSVADAAVGSLRGIVSSMNAIVTAGIRSATDAAVGGLQGRPNTPPGTSPGTSARGVRPPGTPANYMQAEDGSWVPPSFFGFAGGTPNFAGGMAMVGEGGPELSVMPSGTGIFSAADTHSLFSMLHSLIRAGPTQGFQPRSEPSSNSININHLELPGVQNARDFVSELDALQTRNLRLSTRASLP